MGSLTSRPKSPPRPSIVYVRKSRSAATGLNLQKENSGSRNVKDAQNEENKQNSQGEAEIRKDNLLRRNRGRIGTIRTGFRGLLSQGIFDKPRKTLLGE